MSFFLASTWLVLLFGRTSSVSSKPNIFLLLIDDLGWNDLSLHGGCDYSTPNLDALAQDGLQLNNYYVQHMCTPSRHSLMSGRYPISDGMQEDTIKITMPFGMPMDLVTLPEMLKTAGYRTHMLGKWHLGFCLTDYTPTRRGFDTHLGFWGGGEDYFLKNKTSSPLQGIDFRDQTTPIRNGNYSTYIYGNETLRILKEYVEEDTEEPFFLYFSSQAVHGPFSAPEYLEKYFEKQITTKSRAKLAAVTTVLDDTVGLIVDYMKSDESGNLWDNTIFIVSSDNGGAVNKGSSNFPLRGGKLSLWEGGIRATAWITGGLLPDNRRGESMDALMHISDWFPTLCDLAGIDYEVDGVQELDGFSQLDNLLNGESSPYEPRDLLVHNIQPNGCDKDVCGAIRWRNYKIIGGIEADYTDECMSGWCNKFKMLDSYLDSMTIQCNDGGYNYPDIDYTLDCPYNGYPCLFDMDADPCEYVDLRESEPEIYAKMYDLLLQYNETQKMPTLFSLHTEDFDGSNPDLYGGFWSPWKDVEPKEENVMEAVVVEHVEEKSDMIRSTWSIRAVLLVIAGCIIKILFDFWTQRGSYKKIGDTIDIGSYSSI